MKTASIVCCKTKQNKKTSNTKALKVVVASPRIELPPVPDGTGGREDLELRKLLYYPRPNGVQPGGPVRTAFSRAGPSERRSAGRARPNGVQPGGPVRTAFSRAGIVLRGHFCFQKSSSGSRFKVFFSGDCFLFIREGFIINQSDRNIRL